MFLWWNQQTKAGITCWISVIDNVLLQTPEFSNIFIFSFSYKIFLLTSTKCMSVLNTRYFMRNYCTGHWIICEWQRIYGRPQKPTVTDFQSIVQMFLFVILTMMFYRFNLIEDVSCVKLKVCLFIILINDDTLDDESDTGCPMLIKLYFITIHAKLISRPPNFMNFQTNIIF